MVVSLFMRRRAPCERSFSRGMQENRSDQHHLGDGTCRGQRLDEPLTGRAPPHTHI